MVPEEDTRTDPTSPEGAKADPLVDEGANGKEPFVLEEERPAPEEKFTEDLDIPRSAEVYTHPAAEAGACIEEVRAVMAKRPELVSELGKTYWFLRDLYDQK